MKHLSHMITTSLFLFAFTTFCAAQIPYETVERSELGPVWSGHPVGCALLTDGDVQFAAFYDADRNLTLAQRKIDETDWTFNRLPTKIGWDSHNYVTMILDGDKYLHVAGNMHCVPLIYFRSEKPLDIHSLRQIPEMVGTEEKRCTYPKFLFGPGKELIFTYRDGSSGNGNQIWNVYRLKEKCWHRLLDKPMFDGRGKMNAYFHGPLVGPDGFYHVSWMWRNTPDCATNHDFSYARSKDLKHWENSRGEAITLPITLDNGEIVDSAQPGEGLINPNQTIGFDSRGRVVLSYTRYDEKGASQIYSVRREADGWKRYQTSDWTYRWDFKGGGTMIGEVGLGPVQLRSGRLVQHYRNVKEGSGTWLLDEETLKPTGKAPGEVRWPKEVGVVELKFPGVRCRHAWDLRDADRSFGAVPDVRYVMVWESLPSNRDRAHDVTPPPSTLRVLKLQAK